MNESLYKKQLRHTSVSAIGGTIKKIVTIGDQNVYWDAGVIQAFLADDDLQEMTIVSESIGFMKTLTKLRVDA